MGSRRRRASLRSSRRRRLSLGRDHGQSRALLRDVRRPRHQAVVGIGFRLGLPRIAGRLRDRLAPEIRWFGVRGRSDRHHRRRGGRAHRRTPQPLGFRTHRGPTGTVGRVVGDRRTRRRRDDAGTTAPDTCRRSHHRRASVRRARPRRPRGGAGRPAPTVDRWPVVGGGPGQVRRTDLVSIRHGRVLPGS